MSDGGTGISPQQIQVRQVSHYQFTWVDGGPNQPGTYTIQLVLDQGAAEYVIMPTSDDADVLHELLQASSKVFFDMDRKVLMFGTTDVG